MTEPVNNLLATAKDAVRVHAEAIRAAFLACDHAVTNKADHTLVTATDTDAERAMRSLIAKRYPTHDILGEELGESMGSDESHEYRWVIDPIDGTRNFAHGVPLFVSAAVVMKGDELIASATYHPIFGELLWASAGGGAFSNGERLQLTSGQTLSAALVNFDRHRSRVHEFSAILEQISGTIGSPRVYGSGLYTMGKLASGCVDAMVMLHSNLWDIAPGLLIAREAGAVGVDFAGQTWQPGGSELIVAHPDLAKQLVTALGKEKETHD